ncbi:MAG TPA: hypothetical protein VJR92_16015 [Gemmatimonadaceae bacterium]|nr:hypothetical protein [Gemmatimonadaceae bacterium]
MPMRGTPEFIEHCNAALTAWDAAHSTERLWKKDASLWTATSEAQWLGWLDAPFIARPSLNALETTLRSAVPGNTRDALLLGMGGSSLAAEVIARVARGDGARTLHIIDSTEPSFVRDAFARIDWHTTMCVVASKSGTTLEPDILLATALAHARERMGTDAARHFVAITDPGSALAKHAHASGFAAVIDGEPAIGGRFSALSPFGLVPAMLHGVGLAEFVESAKSMANACRSSAPANPGAQLGVFLGVAAREGRNKCTLVLPASLAPLGAWIEQLIAESTGKRGVAILPIDGEPLASPDVYGADRAFVRVRDLRARDDHGAAVDALAARGHPVFEFAVDGAASLAGEFFRWEFATAVAGAILGVNPFDQPDVEAAKVATRAITDAQEKGGASTVRAPADENSGIRALLASVRDGDYVALLAFLPMTQATQDVLQRVRASIRDKTRAATTVGFGPRYLHSTGQAFKGGPNSGVFMQLTCDAPNDLAIPGRRVTFGSVVEAQAAGDRQVLRERGRRVLHIHLDGDLPNALERFAKDVESALR